MGRVFSLTHIHTCASKHAHSLTHTYFPSLSLFSTTALSIPHGAQRPTQVSSWQWKGSERVTPKYAILAQGLFWAEGDWETADAGKSHWPASFYERQDGIRFPLSSYLCFNVISPSWTGKRRTTLSTKTTLDDGKDPSSLFIKPHHMTWIFL